MTRDEFETLLDRLYPANAHMRIGVTDERQPSHSATAILTAQQAKEEQDD